MQAALLLSGQLEIHAGALADAVHPWFFIEDGGRLYPKYNPVPAAMYAVSMWLFGEPRATLAVVAAGNAALVYVLGSTAFDRRVGLAAAVLFVASPLALATSSVFLPYAPTTLLNLLFAVAYLGASATGRSRSPGSRASRSARLLRPAVHGGVVRGAVHPPRGGSGRCRGPGGGDSVTLFPGQSVATGSRRCSAPFSSASPRVQLPADRLAPHLPVRGVRADGRSGFGERRILGHSEEYTLELALRSNGYALWYLATRWVVAGPLGTLLAFAGGGLATRRWLSGRRALAEGTAAWNLSPNGASSEPRAPARRCRRLRRRREPLLLGTNNLLATLGPDQRAGRGFRTVLPLRSPRPAVDLRWRRRRRRRPGLSRLRVWLASRVTPESAQAIVVAVAVLALFGGALGAAAVVEAPLDRHAAYADKYEAAYEPIESASFDDDLVFVPTPYGEWLQHPFQSLRNDPGLDGEVVYALNRDPAEDFAVIDAYPDRELHRYAYRGSVDRTRTATSRRSSNRSMSGKAPGSTRRRPSASPTVFSARSFDWRPTAATVTPSTT